MLFPEAGCLSCLLKTLSCFSSLFRGSPAVYARTPKDCNRCALGAKKVSVTRAKDSLGLVTATPRRFSLISPRRHYADVVAIFLTTKGKPMVRAKGLRRPGGDKAP